MCGQLEASRQAALHMREALTNTGEASGLAGLAGVCAVAEEQAGHTDAAEQLYEEAATGYADIGLKDGQATMLARHARMLARHGELGRAETLLDEARRLAMPGDYETRAHITQAEALLHAHRGQSVAAWAGVQRCFATYAGMDLINDIAEAHATAATVARLLGQARESRNTSRPRRTSSSGRATWCGPGRWGNSCSVEKRPTSALDASWILEGPQGSRGVERVATSIVQVPRWAGRHVVPVGSQHPTQHNPHLALLAAYWP